MYANPKETTSLRLDGTMKRRSRDARAARDDPDGGVRGVHGRARLPGRAAHEGEPRGEGQHHEDPVRGLHGEWLRGRRGRRAPWGRGRKMSCSAKMRKLSVRIDADLKAAFEGTLRDIGVDPTCAMRSFAFQIVLEGSIPFDPVDAGFEASGKTAVTSAKIPEDVAGEMESVLKGLGTNFSQVVRLLALQTTALGGMPFAAGIPQEAS